MVSTRLSRLMMCLLLDFALAINFNYKISEIHNSIASKEVNCKDVINYYLERSYRYNPKLHAIINFNPNALKEALVLDDSFNKTNKLIGINFIVYLF